MSSIRTLTRRAALVAVTATAALTLAACGGDGGHDGGHGSSSSSSASSGVRNAQDVSFAQGMIPHHRQALEMASLAADRASSAQVRDLAARIEKAQDPEIKTMSGWLRTWGEEMPEASPGMDHAGHSGMAGMMDPADMEKLAKTSGKDFDTMFLTMMVEHHEGAVEMATEEKAKGGYAPAKAMADDIITAQNAEIAEMNKILGENGY